MSTPLGQKSSLEQIRQRFDNDVERFSVLETGQKATIDAPLAMELITQAALAATPDARNLLDIGCGAGNNTLKLLQLCPHLNCTLLDISQPMLDRAQQRVSSHSTGQVTTLQSDFRTADFPSGSFDILIAAAVFHHLRDDQDWENTFAKAFSLLRPGGSLWITDLVTQESDRIHALMWKRYGEYLVTIGGEKYRDDVMAYIDQEDSPRSVTYQLDLLRRVGFHQVEILHKNSCFAAFGAIKR
ncbi:MAG: class I SAM-dependent methyltransferase [Planctomycetaceae bacterium]